MKKLIITLVVNELQTIFQQVKPLEGKCVKVELKKEKWIFKTFFGAEWFFLEKSLYFYTLKQFRQKCRY